MATSNGDANESAINNIELVDIEDIVPPNGGNSLFLCIARALIYMSWKIPAFNDELNNRGISKSDLKCDIHLQATLRKMLCEYWCNNEVILNQNINNVILSEEYSK